MRTNVPTRSRNAPNNEALERGRFAIQAGRAVEAERIAREILSSNSGSREATKILGYAQIMLGQCEQAVSSLEKAARGSHDSELETQIGIALRHCGRSNDAAVWLRRAVKRKPPRAVSFYELGLLLASMRQFEEAIDVLKRGVEAAPLMAEMRIQLGYAYDGINDRKSAVACFRQVLARNPAHPAASAGLGSMFVKERNFVGAAELFHHLVMANPADADLRISLGTCLLNLGQTDAALACMRAAAARGPRFYSRALRTLVSSARGRFWMRPSDAAKSLRGA